MADNDNEVSQNVVLHPDFGDIESMWNLRKWLEKAVEAKGGEVVGGGMGMGSIDIEVRLEGFSFDLSMKPRIKS